MLKRAELSGQADSEFNLGGLSKTMYYIGLDVLKKTINYCVKDVAGCVLQAGRPRSEQARTGCMGQNSTPAAGKPVSRNKPTTASARSRAA